MRNDDDPLAERDQELAELCERFGVVTLALFGSATGDSFDPQRSDVDFMVELDSSSDLSRFDAYFGLKDGLEALVGRPVDLISAAVLENPYLAESIARTRQVLYAA